MNEFVSAIGSEGDPRDLEGKVGIFSDPDEVEGTPKNQKELRGSEDVIALRVRSQDQPEKVDVLEDDSRVLDFPAVSVEYKDKSAARDKDVGQEG